MLKAVDATLTLFGQNYLSFLYLGCRYASRGGFRYISSTAIQRFAPAKELRKLGDPTAGPALVEALHREVTDPRTWETQCQMIMALGHSGYRKGVLVLNMLAQVKFEATMVLVAIGDAFVRLGRRSRQ